MVWNATLLLPAPRFSSSWRRSVCVRPPALPRCLTFFSCCLFARLEFRPPCLCPFGVMAVAR
jgi:hypothetical protein